MKAWFGGLISAVSGGLSGSLGAAMADPTDFNTFTPEGLHRMMVVALFSALPVVFAYLKQSPLPGVKIKP